MNWQLSSNTQIPTDLLDFAGGDSLLARLLVQRGISSVDQARAFLDPEAYLPARPTDLPDLDLAVDRLNRAIRQKELIGVWGDFDVDGQTSTALLVSTLKNLGVRVCSYIPDRLTESHGIKIPALKRLLAQGVNLILTCDTGIAEHEAIQVARVAGVGTIITDHHDLPDTLPPALAVVNPKRLPAGHALATLPGVGVAYKLAEALYQAHRRAAKAESLLDLAALGIVADVAYLAGDTRYLLQKGLQTLSNTSRPGLQALIESANLKTNRLTEDHLGFWLAPRLNALGRLGDANLAVELLTTANRTRARIIALQLEAFNDRRKLLVDRVVVQALSQLEDTPGLADYNAIVLAATDWHPGVVGIAANRLVDQFGKPAILLALRPDGLGRGSARSVPGCDIHQALKTQAHLLTSFGGHPGAAGLSIRADDISAFRRGLSDALAGCAPPEKTLRLDALVELPQISSDLLATIQRLAPFGPGNPRVQLGCVGLRVVQEAVFGKAGSHRRVTVEDEAGHQQEVIWWGGAAERAPAGQFDLAFTLSADDFRGGDVQVEWLAARERTPVSIAQAPEFIDWRSLPNPQAELGRLTTLPSPVIWAEGVTLPGLSTQTRSKLASANSLVIWTAPPGHDIYRQVLALVNPRQIYLVGHPSPLDDLAAFTKQLLGLVKFALNQKQGEINLTDLAAALGHRPLTARLGLDWLVAQGKLVIKKETEEGVVVQAVPWLPDSRAEAVEEMLKIALAETAAYRRFFRQAGLGVLQVGVAG